MTSVWVVLRWQPWSSLLVFNDDGSTSPVTLSGNGDCLGFAPIYPSYAEAHEEYPDAEIVEVDIPFIMAGEEIES